jgi:hypothetical protein
MTGGAQHGADQGDVDRGATARPGIRSAQGGVR